MEKRDNRIRLHTGAFLSHGEMILSSAHGREKTNESCWTLANVKLRAGGGDWHTVVCKVIRFVFCRLSGGPAVEWIPPPYRAAIAILYSTQEVHTPYGVVYKADLRHRLEHAGQATLNLDLSGTPGTNRELVSILNLDHVQRKVVALPDDQHP